MEPNTLQYILLPDGTYAAVVQQMSYGEATLILLLAALLFLKIYELWRRL